jgi:hypothetical protein
MRGSLSLLAQASESRADGDGGEGICGDNFCAADGPRSGLTARRM